MPSIRDLLNQEGPRMDNNNINQNDYIPGIDSFALPPPSSSLYMPTPPSNYQSNNANNNNTVFNSTPLQPVVSSASSILFKEEYYTPPTQLHPFQQIQHRNEESYFKPINNSVISEVSYPTMSQGMPPLVGHANLSQKTSYAPSAVPTIGNQRYINDAHIHPVYYNSTSTMSHPSTNNYVSGRSNSNLAPCNNSKPTPVMNNNLPINNNVVDNNINDDDVLLNDGLPIGGQQGKFRRGWSKEEHVRFLLGVYLYGRGNWKIISKIIPGKSPKQVQSHAQKYFLRQDQQTKTKRSIHDFNFSDLMQLVRDKEYRRGLIESDVDLHNLFCQFEESYEKAKQSEDLGGSLSTSSSVVSSNTPLSTAPGKGGKAISSQVHALRKARSKPY
ncbi:hypothetical protein ABK040_009398 [Willaertia magna]